MVLLRLIFTVVRADGVAWVVRAGFAYDTHLLWVRNLHFMLDVLETS